VDFGSIHMPRQCCHHPETPDTYWQSSIAELFAVECKE
jgi:predicted secreted protein